MTDDKLVTIGAIAKPHGVKGELCMNLYAESPLLFESLETIWLRRGTGRPAPYRIDAWRVPGMPGARMLLTLSGVHDRDKAESLRGFEVLASADDLPPADEDEVYLHELEGLDVLLPSGERLGVLDGFLEAGGSEVWSIRTDDGREILLPAEKEFVEDIDLDAGVIRVCPPPGLVELYLGEAPEAGGAK